MTSQYRDRSGADTSWQKEGLCRDLDPDLFFPERGDDVRAAREVCLRCPVREACLMYALDHVERFGIWGGKSERERRSMRRGRGLRVS